MVFLVLILGVGIVWMMIPKSQMTPGEQQVARAAGAGVKAFVWSNIILWGGLILWSMASHGESSPSPSPSPAACHPHWATMSGKELSGDQRHPPRGKNAVWHPCGAMTSAPRVWVPSSAPAPTTPRVVFDQSKYEWNAQNSRAYGNRWTWGD